MPVATTNPISPIEVGKHGKAPDRSQSVSLAAYLVALVAGVYVMGVAVSLIRFFLGLRETAKLRGGATNDGPEWQSASARWSKTLGIRGEVPVAVTDRLQVPATLGWLRPVILVPCRLAKIASSKDQPGIRPTQEGTVPLDAGQHATPCWSTSWPRAHVGMHSGNICCAWQARFTGVTR